MIAGTITGNVGQDARLGSAGDTPVLNFSVASRRWDKGAEQTDWCEIAFWGQRATKLAEYVTKGSRVAVRGTFHVREYEHNGAKKYALTCRADDVELLGKPEGMATTPKPGPARTVPQPMGSEERLPF